MNAWGKLNLATLYLNNLLSQSLFIDKIYSYVSIVSFVDSRC